MFNVKMVFKGKFQNKFLFKKFFSYDKALDFVYLKQSTYSNYIIGFIFDVENQLKITVNKNGLISCLSA